LQEGPIVYGVQRIDGAFLLGASVALKIGQKWTRGGKV